MPTREHARRGGATLGLLFLLAFAPILAASPPAALASTAAVKGSTLKYEAASGEVNNVTSMLAGGVYTITDTGAAITAGAGCTSVNAGQVTCPAAAVTKVRIVGKNLNDVLLAGGAGPYALSGGEGNDTLISGDAGDKLDGGSGNDFLDGGLGADSYKGGSGADSFFTRDGFIDETNCGSDGDIVEADLQDRVNASNCEDVRRADPAPGPTGPTGTPGTPGAPGPPGAPGAPAPSLGPLVGGQGVPSTACRAVRISRRVVRLIGTRVGIRLTAPRSATGRCRGVLRLDALLPRRVRAAARTRLRIGSRKFSLRPGQRRTIRVKITRSGRRAIRRLRRVRTRVKAHVRRGAGVSRITRRVITVRAPRRRR